MNEEPMDRFKRFLETSPENGWVFGVCATIAKRTGWELWAVRGIAAACLLLFTLASCLVYLALGMLMDETRPGTQRKLSRWARQADRVVDRIWSGLKQFFDNGTRAYSHRHDSRYETRDV
ncbi:MAG: PspC domain-containing protein [Xanthomonadales bacterium]|nr:PspC domain-containing protein [Xanthomonadales bacterium]